MGSSDLPRKTWMVDDHGRKMKSRGDGRVAFEMDTKVQRRARAVHVYAGKGGLPVEGKLPLVPFAWAQG